MFVRVPCGSGGGSPRQRSYYLGNNASIIHYDADNNGSTTQAGTAGFDNTSQSLCGNIGSNQCHVMNSPKIVQLTYAASTGYRAVDTTNCADLIATIEPPNDLDGAPTKSYYIVPDYCRPRFIMIRPGQLGSSNNGGM